MSGIKERLRRIREVIDRLPPCASELANAKERLRSRYTVALDLQCHFRKRVRAEHRAWAASRTSDADNCTARPPQVNTRSPMPTGGSSMR